MSAILSLLFERSKGKAEMLRKFKWSELGQSEFKNSFQPRLLFLSILFGRQTTSLLPSPGFCHVYAINKAWVLAPFFRIAYSLHTPSRYAI